MAGVHCRLPWPHGGRGGGGGRRREGKEVAAVVVLAGALWPRPTELRRDYRRRQAGGRWWRRRLAGSRCGGTLAAGMRGGGERRRCGRGYGGRRGIVQGRRSVWAYSYDVVTAAPTDLSPVVRIDFPSVVQSNKPLPILLSLFACMEDLGYRTDRQELGIQKKKHW